MLSSPPHHLARRKVEAGENRIVEAVKIAVGEQDAAVMIVHAAGEVHLFGSHLAVLHGQIEQPAAGASIALTASISSLLTVCPMPS